MAGGGPTPGTPGLTPRRAGTHAAGGTGAHLPGWAGIAGGAARGLGPGGGGEDRVGLGRRAGSESVPGCGPPGPGRGRAGERCPGQVVLCGPEAAAPSRSPRRQRRRFVPSISSLRLLRSPQPSPWRRRVTREVLSAGQIGGFWKIGLQGLRRAALGKTAPALGCQAGEGKAGRTLGEIAPHQCEVPPVRAHCLPVS